MTKSLGGLLVLTVVAGLAGAGVASRAATAGDAASPMSPLPPPDGDAVWAYLQSAHYRDSWTRWPGTKAFYPGTEPHGALLTTYVNETARRSMEAGDAALAPGSIVVKENYTPERKLAATTVMFKSAGFDPEHHDWFWAKVAPDGSIQASGRVDSCIGCHGRAADNDYIRSEKLGR